MRRALGTALVALSILSIAASCFLALSYTTLKGVADVRPLVPLVLFVAESGVTLVWVRAGVAGMPIEMLTVAGAAALAYTGYALIVHTLAGPHFEGYELVMGAVGLLQGAMTCVLFCARRGQRSLRNRGTVH